MRTSAGRESLRRRALWSAWLAVNAPLQARFPFRAPEAIERAQRRRIEATVVHAQRHVPYYRETMRRLGLGPGDIRTAGDLARLPLIEREQVQRDPEYFRSRAWPADTYLRLRSGGSTGEPVTIFRHPAALFEGAAYRERIRAPIMRIVGARVRFREALIALPDDREGAREQFARRTLIPSSVRVVRRRFSLLSAHSETLAELNRFRPDVIATYGSYIAALFQHVVESGAPFACPKVVVYSADLLPEPVRKMISERFGAAVLSAYRAIEAPYIGFECEQHAGHHLNVDLCTVRIVDSRGRDLPPDEPGDVVVSNLYGHGTILLNYRLGDVAARLAERCPCGRSLPMLSMVRGRTDEWLVGARGEPIHGQAIRELMRRRDEVLRYQVVQQGARRLGVSVIVRAGSEHESLARWIEDRIRQRLGESFAVAVSFPDDLPRTAGGKTRPIVPLAVGSTVAPSGGD